MAPLRRYLRITKYSVLEVRIYLDNPHLADTWLLNPRRPILPKVIQSVRPLVLPKLREENERRRKGGSKKKAVKDTVIEDDFEVSIFLTDNSTRHTILTKHKTFKGTNEGGLRSNSSKLTGATQDNALDVDQDDSRGGMPGGTVQFPTIIRAESLSEDEQILDNVPAIDSNEGEALGEEMGQSRDAAGSIEHAEISDDEDGLFVAETQSRSSKRRRAASNTNDDVIQRLGASKRTRRGNRPVTSDMPDDDQAQEEAEDDVVPTEILVPNDDDKKKMVMDVTYDGFTIYGHVLCLIVRRRDRPGNAGGLNGGTNSDAAGSTPAGTGSKAMMEDWIASAQVPLEEPEGG